MSEPQWPVYVYRRTIDRRWQKLRPRNSRGQIVIVKAAPRRDSIVLSSLRIRIRLRSDSTSSDQQSDQQQQQEHIQNSTNNNNDKNHGSVIVRRRDRILIAQPTRALVLRFRTLRDCLDFCDRLIELNPVCLDRSVPSVSTTAASKSASETPLPTATTTPQGSGILTSTTTKNFHNDASIQTREILSCVGRLLCDPDFSHLVNRLEEVVMQSEDGRSLLEALVAQNEESCNEMPI
jgi:hypothetical protein